MTVKEWIDLLDSSTETMSQYDSTVGIEPRSLGWGGPAQRLGYTKQHPLDAVFIPPITIYRNEDDLLDMIEQVEASERAVAEGVAAVNAAGDEGERRSLLNIHFSQHRSACSFPSECAYVRVCYGGDDIRRAPLASGLFAPREVNHPQELEGAAASTGQGKEPRS